MPDTMPDTMNPSINTIPTAQLYGNYTLWNPVEETWSEPTTYTAAVEAYARDPELQASLILPDGTTTAPAPMSEIIKRAHTTSTKARPEPTLTKKIKDLLNEPLPGLLDPLPGTTTSKPSATPAAPRPSTPAATLPAETIYLLHHALRLFLCVTYGTLYLTAAGAIIGGLASDQNALAFSGLILGLITAVVHATLSGRTD